MAWRGQARQNEAGEAGTVWNGKEADVHKQTFTKTLMRLIRKTLCDMANEDGVSTEASGALYRASNEIGRRHVDLVTKAREAMNWQEVVANHEEGSSGR